MRFGHLHSSLSLDVQVGTRAGATRILMPPSGLVEPARLPYRLFPLAGVRIGESAVPGPVNQEPRHPVFRELAAMGLLAPPAPADVEDSSVDQIEFASCLDEDPYERVEGAAVGTDNASEDATDDAIDVQPTTRQHSSPSCHRWGRIVPQPRARLVVEAILRLVAGVNPELSEADATALFARRHR